MHVAVNMVSARHWCGVVLIKGHRHQWRYGLGVSLRGTPLTLGGGPRVVVSTAAFHARVRGSVPGLGDLKETKNVSSPSTCESQYCGEPP